MAVVHRVLSRSWMPGLAVLAVALVLGGPALPTAAQVDATNRVELTLSAIIDASGITIRVSAPGCEPTIPENLPDIVIQSRNPTTGEVGEGAVAVGEFTAPGVGFAVIPSGTPVDSFLVTVRCNGGALEGSQAFTLAAPATPVVAVQPNFTG